MAGSAVFVPVEAWYYNSPELRRAGRAIDIGLLAEALVFYDTVYFGFSTDEQFARVVAWFRSAGMLDTLVALIRDGVLVPYYYSFSTNAGHFEGVWQVMNLQDEEAARQSVIESRVLRSPRLMGLIKKTSALDELSNAVMNRHIEVKASDFGAVVTDARADYQDEHSTAFLVQILVDELHKELGFPRPPQVTAKITEANGVQRIEFNMNFEKLFSRLGPSMSFHAGIPLVGATTSAKTLWSAAMLGSDLYVGSPLSSYIDFKLDAGNKSSRTRAIVEELVGRADFPDIRKLTIQGRIGPEEVMALRKHGARFREWLSSEKQFDRDAVLAYLGQISQAAGWRKDLGTIVRAVGLFGGAAVAAASETALGVVGAALAGGGTQFVADIAARIAGGWRPAVFGARAQSIVTKAESD